MSIHHRALIAPTPVAGAVLVLLLSAGVLTTGCGGGGGGGSTASSGGAGPTARPQATPSPSPTPQASPSPSPIPSPTPSPSASPSPSPSPSPAPSPSPVASPSPSPAPSPNPTDGPAFPGQMRAPESSSAPALARSDARAALGEPFSVADLERPNGRVIGTDDRYPVPDTTAAPYRGVCRLFYRFPNTPAGYYYMATGTLIGRNHVLTVAHSVYNHDEGGWATSIRVVPGLEGTYMPFGDAYATNMLTFNGWIENRDSGYDLGVIRLDRDLGLTTGWMGLAWSDDAPSRSAEIIGYPGEVQHPSDPVRGLRMYGSSGPLRANGSEGFTFDIDITKGQSGSAIATTLPYYVAGQRREERFAVGVNAYEVNSDPGFNGGPRITSGKFAAITAFLDAGGDTGPRPQDVKVLQGTAVLSNGQFTRIYYDVSFQRPPVVVCTAVDGGKGGVVAVLNPYPTEHFFEVSLNGGWTLPVNWIAVGR